MSAIQNTKLKNLVEKESIRRQEFKVRCLAEIKTILNAAQFPVKILSLSGNTYEEYNDNYNEECYAVDITYLCDGETYEQTIRYNSCLDDMDNKVWKKYKGSWDNYESTVNDIFMLCDSYKITGDIYRAD
jgi:predicted MPP superfamily phosphohydrolase